MSMDLSLWQMIPGHILCTHSSGPLALPEWGQGAGATLSTVTHRCLGLCASVFPCEVQPPWQGCQ